MCWVLHRGSTCWEHFVRHCYWKNIQIFFSGFLSLQRNLKIKDFFLHLCSHLTVQNWMVWWICQTSVEYHQKLGSCSGYWSYVLNKIANTSVTGLLSFGSSLAVILRWSCFLANKVEKFWFWSSMLKCKASGVITFILLETSLAFFSKYSVYFSKGN